MGDEGLYLPNYQKRLLIALHAHCLFHGELYQQEMNNLTGPIVNQLKK